MKISIECDCVLLQNTLLLFCKDYMAHHKDCDFVVSDKRLQTKKPLFLVGCEGAHLELPFTRANLKNTLLEFYSAIQISPKKPLSAGFELELDGLLASFRDELAALVKKYK